MFRLDPLRRGLSDPAGRWAMPLDGPPETGNARLASVPATGQAQSADPEPGTLEPPGPEPATLEPPGPESSRRPRGRRARTDAPASSAASRPDLVTCVIAAAVFAAYTVISVFRYLRHDPTSWDLGIFTEYVKQYAHLRAPIVDVRGAGFNLMGDHFHPIVAVIAPFFRLFPTPVNLLVPPALLAAVSVFPVRPAARELLGPRPGPAIPAAFALPWRPPQIGQPPSPD